MAQTGARSPQTGRVHDHDGSGGNRYLPKSPSRLSCVDAEKFQNQLACSLLQRLALSVLCPKIEILQSRGEDIIPTETVLKINAPLHLETNEVKFGFSMLSKAEVPSLPLGPERCRLVSPVRKRKGTISFFGIGSDGKAYRYELQRRDIKKDETKSVLATKRRPSPYSRHCNGKRRKPSPAPLLSGDRTAFCSENRSRLKTNRISSSLFADQLSAKPDTGARIRFRSGSLGKNLFASLCPPSKFPR